MATLDTIELKTFIPSRDFELSRQFYQDVGVFLAWDGTASRIFIMGMKLSVAEFLCQGTCRKFHNAPPGREREYLVDRNS